jgi:ubiquinone/menaquinone biosynthesis C-methylase UbiE
MAQAETEKLTEMVLSAALSRAVCSVAEFGIADQIQPGSPQTVAALAQATGTHEGTLYRILRFLASHGLFQETGPRQFDHTLLSECLRSDVEGSFRPAARMLHRIFPAWDGLHHAALTGQPGFNEVYGKPIFDYVATDPELGPILDAGMTAIHGHETAAMLEAYDFHGIRTLADIGGGNGSLLGFVMQIYSNLNGILFDLDHVVERARARLEAYRVADRCRIIAGSFFDSVPAGADAYLFRHIIHDWADEQAVQILSNCRRVIPDDGRLLLVEAVVPEGNERALAKDFDMTMLAFPGGVERTEAEYRELLSQAGFGLNAITPTTTMVSINEGRPK